MHFCPNCDSVCDCDESENPPQACDHQCGHDDEDLFDCGRDRRGYCAKAGSEECDFECPYRGRLHG